MFDKVLNMPLRLSSGKDYINVDRLWEYTLKGQKTFCPPRWEILEVLSEVLSFRFYLTLS